MEPFLLSKRQCPEMDRQVAALGRIPMHGRASWVVEEGTRSTGTKEVLNFWGLASCETELGVRGLA
eukprot:4791980-Lingulodinium_polyedra.AAC.1